MFCSEEAPRRSPVGSALLAAGIAVAHLFVAYFGIVLFARVTYAGWPPVVPWLFLGAYAASLVGIALAGLRRVDAAGGVLGVGTVALAAEPFVSTFLVGAGCEVGGSGALGLPAVAVDGVRLTMLTPGGACNTAVALPVVVPAAVLVAVGVRRGAVPVSPLRRLVVAAGGPSRSRE